MSAVKHILIKARRLIDTPDKWCKRIPIKTDKDTKQTSYCAVKAVDMCSPKRTKHGGIRPLYQQAIFALHVSGTPAIIRYNDHKDTEHSDILNMFDAAIKAQ